MRNRRGLVGSWAGVLALVVLVLWGCGGSSTQTGGGGAISGTGAAAGSPVPAASAVPLRGRAIVRNMTLLPANSVQAALGTRAALQAEGYRLSPDGSLLVWPDEPAAGWRVEFGAQNVFAGTDGSFVVIDDGTPAGYLHHPANDAIKVPFTLTSLQAAGRAGGALVIPFAFHGSCGMNAGNDVSCCEQGCVDNTVPPTGSARTADAVADDCRPALHSYNANRQVIHQRRGAYPDPAVGRARLVYCVINDGIITNSSVSQKIRYFGSTCDVYVRGGACPNENAFSDVEYNAKIVASNGLVGFLSDLVLGGGDVQLSPPLVPGFSIHCHQNHKKRNCAMVCIGDVSADFPADGLLIPTSGSGTLTVQRCDKKSFVVHNDGNYGITRIIKRRNDIGGTLSGSNLVSQEELRHYLPLNFVADFEADNDVDQYVPDQELVYSPRKDAPSGAVDTYEFLVDDRSVTVSFRLADCGSDNPLTPPTPTPTPASPSPSPSPSTSPSPVGSPSPSPGYYLAVPFDTSGGLGVLRIDPTTFLPTGSVSGSPFATGSTPNQVVFDSTASFGYVTNANDTTISAFRVNPDGTLLPVTGSPFASGTRPTYLTLTPSGSFLYACNVGAATISGFAVNGGALTPVPGSPFATGNQPQQCVVTSDGAFLYVPCIGTGKINGYAIGGNGALTPLASSPTTAGTAPRLAVTTHNANGSFLYVGNQISFSISGYRVNPDGSLTATPNSPYATGNSPFGIASDPSGRFVYATNFGDDTVSGFATQADGSLSPIAGSPFATGHGPAYMSLDAPHGVLFVGNYSADTISAYRWNSQTGALTLSGSTPTNANPSGMTFFSR